MYVSASATFDLDLYGIGGRVSGPEPRTKISIHNRAIRGMVAECNVQGILSGCGGSHGAGGLICVVLVEFP